MSEDLIKENLNLTTTETVVILRDRFFTWLTPLSRGARTVNKLRRQFDTILSVIVLFAGVTSFFFFCFWVFWQGSGHLFLQPSYWLEPKIDLFFLFLSAFLFEMATYRLVDSLRRAKKISRKAYLDVKPEIGPKPNNAHLEDIACYVDSASFKIIEEAFVLAERFRHATVEPVHLFSAALSANKALVVFGRLGVRFDDLRPFLEKRMSEFPLAEQTVFGEAEKVIAEAFVSAFQQGLETVTVLEILQTVFHSDPLFTDWLSGHELTPEQFDSAVEWVRINEKLKKRYEYFRRAALHKPVGDMNRAMTSVATPLLDSVCDDLTAAAVYGRLPLLVGRENEMRNLLRVLESGGQSVVLVGPPGVGKEAIIAGLAERMVEEDVPEILKDKRLLSLSLPAVLSGASAEKAEERLLTVLHEVAKSKNIILAVFDVEQLTGITAGSEHTMDLASVLADALTRGITFLIATTTSEAYSTAVAPSALGRSLQKIEVVEPDTKTAVQILESKAASIESQNNVIFSFDALEKCVKLSDRYLHEAYLPNKAIEIAKEAALEAKQKKGSNTLVTGDDVGKIVSQKTGIPLTKVGEDERKKLLHFEERLHERVIGQDEAVRAVSSSLRRARAELRSGKRPIANFLFLGPTGVGKTELTKAVAEVYFGSEKAMIRFDMSEYQDVASIHRLIGNPDTKEGGLLTEAVRREPFSIILLDELEKAHPDILNIFLQVMDDGRLTDAGGRTIDFTSAILIATSNAGTGYIQQAITEKQTMEQIRTRLLETELKGTYRPEFLNRFDAVIVFKPLTIDDVRQIAYLLIKQLAERLEMKGMKFRAEDAVVEELAQKGFDPLFGARPLRRVIQEEVENAVANALLSGEIKPRDTIVLRPGGKVEIEKATL